MQLDILTVLTERDRIGAGVHRELSGQYGTPPSRSTVYDHLDALVGMGLVRKDDGSSSGRAKEYALTDDGTEVIRSYVTTLTVRVQTGEIHRR